MTPNELKEACDKFMDYLTANGARPIAMLIHVVHDENSKLTMVQAGLTECKDELALHAMAQARGLKVSDA